MIGQILDHAKEIAAWDYALPFLLIADRLICPWPRRPRASSWRGRRSSSKPEAPARGTPQRG